VLGPGGAKGWGLRSGESRGQGNKTKDLNRLYCAAERLVCIENKAYGLGEYKKWRF